jgi:hypothetical protein
MNQLCSLCFQNFGVLREAQGLGGVEMSTPCTNCGNVGGKTFAHDRAEELMHRFFVQGSIPPEIGGPAPIYEFNQYRKHGKVFFLTELDNDLSLLSRFLGVGLFHYGPALWKLGYTTHYQALVGNMEDGSRTEGEERQKTWEEVIGRCSKKMLSPPEQVFRVRRGDEMVAALPSQFDTPPEGVASDGRYGSEVLPIFYGAEDVETCLHETRITLADWITMGTLVPTRPLELLDLTDVDDSDAPTAFESVGIFLDKLAFSGSSHYELCRELASEIHARGFDGFFFVSYFAQAHQRRLRNVALFGRPIADGRLRLLSTNRVLLSQISYQYNFGPHNDTSLPIQREEMSRITEMMKAGEIDAKAAAEQIETLLNRKSSGPR